MTIITLARLMAAAFVSAERKSEDTGRAVRMLKADAPEWMGEVVQAAHGDMGPDDYRYEMIEAACDAFAALEDNADIEDVTSAIEEIEPEIYTANLTRWLASRVDRHTYCDDAAEQGMVNKDGGMIALLQAGMAAEQREVCAAVINSLTVCAEAMEAA